MSEAFIRDYNIDSMVRIMLARGLPPVLVSPLRLQYSMYAQKRRTGECNIRPAAEGDNRRKRKSTDGGRFRIRGLRLGQSLEHAQIALGFRHFGNALSLLAIPSEVLTIGP